MTKLTWTLPSAIVLRTNESFILANHWKCLKKIEKFEKLDVFLILGYFVTDVKVRQKVNKSQIFQIFLSFLNTSNDLKARKFHLFVMYGGVQL